MSKHANILQTSYVYRPKVYEFDDSAEYVSNDDKDDDDIECERKAVKKGGKTTAAAKRRKKSNVIAKKAPKAKANFKIPIQSLGVIGGGANAAADSPPMPTCDNHDDGETVAIIVCDSCGNLCGDCDRFLHLHRRTKDHQRQVGVSG